MMDRDSKQSRTATIAISETTSGAIDLGGLAAVGVYVPSAFTGTALSFMACDTVDGTYVPVYVNGANDAYAVAASKYVALNPAVYRMRFLKVVSNAAEGAARTLRVALAEV